MKIPRSGPVWFVVVGIPAIALIVVGMLATLVGWYSLDDKCHEWAKEISK